MDTPGIDGLFTTLGSEKNIWLLFDVDKLPGAPKYKLVSLTLHSFSAGDKQLRISSEGRVKGTGKEVIAPSCEGMNIGGVIGSAVAEREKE